jgi:protein SCO1
VTSSTRRPAARAATRICVLLALGAAAIAALGGCGSSDSQASASKAATKPAAPAKLAAPSEASPPYQAPDFTLRDSLGHTVSLSDYRGKAVLLTFIYDHCPDVCPLIVSSLHNALAKLGPQASKAQVIAVSVDPKGDTPKTVASFLKFHAMTGKMEYLIGSKRKLAPVWKAWGVKVEASPDDREVGHSAFVYGITGQGKVRALYPSNFKAGWVSHDVPILAAG